MPGTYGELMAERHSSKQAVHAMQAPLPAPSESMWRIPVAKTKEYEGDAFLIAPPLDVVGEVWPESQQAAFLIPRRNGVVDMRLLDADERRWISGRNITDPVVLARGISMDDLGKRMPRLSDQPATNPPADPAKPPEKPAVDPLAQYENKFLEQAGVWDAIKSLFSSSTPACPPNWQSVSIRHDYPVVQQRALDQMMAFAEKLVLSGSMTAGDVLGRLPQIPVVINLPCIIVMPICIRGNVTQNWVELPLKEGNFHQDNARCSMTWMEKETKTFFLQNIFKMKRLGFHLGIAVGAGGVQASNGTANVTPAFDPKEWLSGMVLEKFFPEQAKKTEEKKTEEKKEDAEKKASFAAPPAPGFALSGGMDQLKVSAKLTVDAYHTFEFEVKEVKCSHGDCSHPK